MEKNINNHEKLFYEGDFLKAKELFLKEGLYYEAGLCCFLARDLTGAKNFFKKKEDVCPAAAFGLCIIDIIEKKHPRAVGYFQIRAFLEVYINLLIETKSLDWAQCVIDSYEFFTRINLEVPKFIARVLFANNCNRAIHSFAKFAKEICYYDAEIHYIDASEFILEKNFVEAKKCIKECLVFAPEYYPVLKLQKDYFSAI